jgi:hypothetical protein
MPTLRFMVNYREAGQRKRKFFEVKEHAELFAAAKNRERKNYGIAHAEFPEALRIMAQECADRLSDCKRALKQNCRR